MKLDRQGEELIESILERSDRAFRELFPMLPKEWLHLNLTMPQLKVALLLFTGGPSRMSMIASELGVSMATATGVIDRLVDRGLVLREGDASDRRVVICRLSDDGEKLISGLWQLSRDQLGQMLKALAPAQLRLIAEALDALVSAGQARQVNGGENNVQSKERHTDGEGARCAVPCRPGPDQPGDRR